MAKFIIFSVLFLILTAPVAVMATTSGPAVLIHKSITGVQNRDVLATHAFTQRFQSMAACENAKADLDAATFPVVSWVAQSGRSNITLCVPFDQ
jgi:hypothetical protein